MARLPGPRGMRRLRCCLRFRGCPGLACLVSVASPSRVCLVSPSLVCPCRRVQACLGAVAW